MKLSIVIACYYEAKTIPAIVERVRAAPVKDKEIIIVDDGSRDLWARNPFLDTRRASNTPVLHAGRHSSPHRRRETPLHRRSPAPGTDALRISSPGRQRGGEANRLESLFRRQSAGPPPRPRAFRPFLA